MRICDNGVYRDATQEEIEAFEKTPAPEEEPSPTDAEILNILLGGAE